MEAPIEQLPDDILRYIMTLHRFSTLHLYNTPPTFDVALSLSHISRHWGMVSLDHCVLWSSIQLDINEDFIKDSAVAKMKESIAFCLRYARQHDLAVDIRLGLVEFR